jgi:hypothetical protein
MIEQAKLRRSLHDAAALTLAEQGGVPAGNPQDAEVQTTSWNYVWW